MWRLAAAAFVFSVRLFDFGIHTCYTTGLLVFINLNLADEVLITSPGCIRERRADQSSIRARPPIHSHIQWWWCGRLVTG